MFYMYMENILALLGYERYEHDEVTLVISRKKKKLMIYLYDVEYSNF